LNPSPPRAPCSCFLQSWQRPQTTFAVFQFFSHLYCLRRHRIFPLRDPRPPPPGVVQVVLSDPFPFYVFPRPWADGPQFHPQMVPFFRSLGLAGRNLSPPPPLVLSPSPQQMETFSTLFSRFRPPFSSRGGSPDNVIGVLRPFGRRFFRFSPPLWLSPPCFRGPLCQARSLLFSAAASRGRVCVWISFFPLHGVASSPPPFLAPFFALIYEFGSLFLIFL